MTNAFIGGLVIGIAASVLWLFGGRIAGISGILGSAVTRKSSWWQWAFLAGLPLGAFLTAAFSRPDIVIAASPIMLAISGALVGAGTQIGSGCTSGHGVCGIARFSRRSIAATGIFMATAVAVVWARNLLEI